MKEKYNLKSIIVSLIFVIIGGGMVIIDLFWTKLPAYCLISIGCSLIASGLVVLLTTLLVEKKVYSPLDDWHIDKIYATRAEKNADSDPKLDKAKYQVDGIAFGLSSFRSKYGDKVETCLKRGVNFRLLTMDPKGDYISAREKEEGDVPGNIAKSINDLIAWADKLNQRKYKGRIVVKGYSCMTLDFYWRIDNELYVGPYWYDYKSNDTITYRFRSEGKGFQLYSNYFEKLWDNTTLTRVLTKTVRATKKDNDY